VRKAGGERRDGGPERVGVLLGDFLERKGVREQIERTGVVEAWPVKVGDAIAQVTRARGVSERTLFVEVSSSAWLMELNMMRGEILQRVNEGREDALIERIVFVQGEAPEGA
jgi:predicted nucleic acid-binding Zn ribbon protein